MGALWSAFLGCIGIALIGKLVGAPVGEWDTGLIVVAFSAVVLIAFTSEFLGGRRNQSEDAGNPDHRIRDGANARYHERVRT